MQINSRTFLVKFISILTSLSLITFLSFLSVFALNYEVYYSGMPQFALIICFYFAAYLPNYYIFLFVLFISQLYDHTHITLFLLLLSYFVTTKFRKIILQNKLSTLLSLIMISLAYMILRALIFYILYDIEVEFISSMVTIITTMLVFPAIEISLNKLLKPFLDDARQENNS